MTSYLLNTRTSIIGTGSGALLSRNQASHLLRVSSGTLAVWDYRQCYDLRPIKIRSRIYYQKSDLIRYLLKSSDMALLDQPFLLRCEAADYLGRSKDTLAVWDCLKRHDLSPIKVGACVRYSPVYLRNFLNAQMMGKPAEKAAA